MDRSTPHMLVAGGLGSGKSTVGRLLAQRGACVVDADRVGHAVLEPDGEAFGDVAARWPAVAVDGRIDRRALGRVVFADPTQLAELEDLTHPAIRRQITQHLAGCPEGAPRVVEVPLPTDFMGPGWLRVVVDAPDPVRVLRGVERGLSEEEVRTRMAAQPARAVWLGAADYVVDNGGSLTHLEEEVAALWESVVGDR